MLEEYMTGNKIEYKPALKVIYSEMATKFCKISTVDLSYVVRVKSTVEISQKFVAISEYMNFTMYSLAKLFSYQDALKNA